MNRAFMALAGVVLIALPWYLGSPLARFSEWRASSDWPRVEATILSVRAINFADDGKRQTWGDDPQYELVVSYRFLERPLTATLRHEPTAPVSFVGRDAPKAGEKMEILVNPAKPEEVYRGRGELFVLALLVLGGLLGGLYLLWRSLSRASRDGA